MNPYRVLIVCTANVCRSPVVEHLFRRLLAAQGIAANVSSAGTHGGRNTVHRHTIAAADAQGIDLTDHVSRYLDDQRINEDGADLIVTMTRRHVERVVDLVPTAFDRTFTLPELTDLTLSHGVDPLTHTLGEWTAAIGSDRRLSDVAGGGDGLDVDDPYGSPRILHDRMVLQVEGLVGEIVPILAASIDPDGGPTRNVDDQ